MVSETLNTQVDSLGISETENLQIEALKSGASPEDVASVSKQSVEEIPREIESTEISEYASETDQFPEGQYIPEKPPFPEKEAVKRATYASLASDKDIANEYIGMYDQFRAYGSSSIYDSIREEILGQKRAEIQMDIEATARQGDVNGTQALLEASDGLLRQETNLRTVGLDRASQAFTEARESVDADEARRVFFKNLTVDADASGTTVNEKVNFLVDSAIRTNSDDISDYYADNFETAFFGEQAFSLSKVAQEFLGERYIVKGGTMMRDLAQMLRSAPDSEKEELAKKMVDSFVKHSGVVWDNDVVKTYALESFREFYNTPGGDRPFDRWLGDVIGVVDLAGIVPMAATIDMIKGIRRSSSSLGRAASNVRPGLINANPDLDATLDAMALADRKAAEQLGTTPEDVLAKALPQNNISDKFVLEGASDSLLEKIKKVKTRAEEAQDYVDNTYMYHTRDFSAKKKKVLEVLRDESRVGKLKPSLTTLKRSENDNSIVVGAMYGTDSDLPLSLGQAKKLELNLKRAAKDLDSTENDIRIMIKDVSKDVYVPYDREVHGTEGLFYVQMNAKSKMTIDDVVGGTPLEDGGTKAVGNFTGTWAARLAVEPQQYLDRTLLGAARVALDTKGSKTHQIKSITKDFQSLPYKSKKNVAAVLAEGDRDQITYSYNQLVERGLNESEILGYFSARYLNEVAYNIKNSSKKDQMLREGYKGVSIESPNGNLFQNAVKDVDLADLKNNASEVFDPYTGQGIKVSDRAIQDLESKGLTIKKLAKPQEVNDSIFHYVVVKGEDLHELPQKVLAYREGYMFRINKEPYYIDEHKPRWVNGKLEKDHKGTIGVAKSAEEARVWVDKLNAQKSGAKYSARIDRAIDNGESLLENDLNRLDGAGLQFWFSQRGAPLTTMAGEVGAVEDPITAMNRMTASIANVSTHGELLDTAIKRHRLTYKDVKDSNGRPLWEWNTVKGDYHFDMERARSIGNAEASAAIAEYKYLELMKYTPTAVDLQFKQMTAAFSNNMVGKAGFGSRAAAGAARELSKVSISGVPRAIAFSATIPLRPVRHILMQGTTGATLFGIDPKITMLAFRDSSLLMSGLATWQNPSAWARTKAMAKLLGHSEEEFEEMFHSFRKGGKAYSIDSHVAVGEANFAWSRSLPESYAGEAGRLALNALKTPISWGKAVGFDTGELLNQSVTWLFAYKRWQKANPGKKLTQMAKDEIANQARNFSVDMTRTSSFGYQNGALASATQFMAINHKMAIKILGQDPDIGKLGSAAHARYVMGMLAIYGAGGVGLSKAYDAFIKESGVDVPSPLDNALHGGFTSFFLNSALDKAFGSEWGTTRLDVAGSMSPANGVFSFIPDLVKNMMEGNFVEAMGGPSAQIIPNVYNAHKEVTEMWAIRDDLNTPEKVMKSYTTALSQFGSFSDIYKLNLAIAYNERMGKILTVGKDGRPSTVANNWQEVFMRGLTGMGTRGESELYNTHLELHSEIKGSSKKDKSTFDQDVDALVKYMYRTFAEYSDPIERLRRQQAITFALHGGDKERGLRVLRGAQQKFNEDPNFDLFLGDIVKRYKLLDKNADLDAMKNSVRASDAVEESDKQQLIDYIDTLGTSIDASKELIDEVFK